MMARVSEGFKGLSTDKLGNIVLLALQQSRINGVLIAVESETLQINIDCGLRVVSRA